MRIDLDPPREQRSLAARVGWFVLIWALSIAALGAVATLLRWWLKP